MPKLQVQFRVWNTPGQKNVFINHKGKKLVMCSLQEARNFAAKNGYSGITVKCV